MNKKQGYYVRTTINSLPMTWFDKFELFVSDPGFVTFLPVSY